MSEWEDKKENVSLEEMSGMVKHMRDIQTKYDAANAVKKEIGKDLDGMKDLIIGTLQAAQLKNFKVPGLGTASIRTSYSVKTPKTVEDKRRLYSFIEEQFGLEILDEYRSINSQTLNAFYNAECDKAEEKGEEFELPGVEEPTAKNVMAWTKDRSGN